MIMVVMAMMRIIGLKHTGGPGPGYNDGDYIVMITMTMVMLMMSNTLSSLTIVLQRSARVYQKWGSGGNFYIYS